MSKRDKQIQQNFKFDGTHVVPEHIPQSEPGRVRYPDDGSGLNAFHLLAFTLLLGGILVAVIFLLGGG